MILDACKALGVDINVCHTFAEERITANRKSKQYMGRQMMLVRGHVIYAFNGNINDHDSCNRRYVTITITEA